MPEQLFYTASKEANRLIASDPMALLIGFALDQQVPVQKAFSGPLVRSGWLARPAYDRGCYGCYGPMETPNTASLDRWSGLEDRDLVRVYRTFNAAADSFHEASRAHE